MKRSLVALTLLAAFLTPSASTQALTHAAKTPLLGGACPKINSTAKAASVSLVCKKVGKKLLWQKNVVKGVTPAPTPKPTSTPTPTSTQSPTKSASPTPSSTSNSSLSPQSSYEINATAKQFSFSFTYAVAGEKTLRLGTDTSLYIPVGKPVQITLGSLDSSHGFWIPGLGVDKEASPDSKARITITSDKIGKFPGSCNIQCGRGHGGMVFIADVVSESDYLKIIGALKAS